ncbi:DNA-binding response regulator [Oxalobacteraceae bacterium CAVE-383]|nr:DNA-binding response regulator [Oxalobacteraceae bacterium CAVE-383]
MPQRIAILASDAGQLAQLTGALAHYRCFPIRHPADLPHPREAADLLLLDLHAMQAHADAWAALLAAGLPVLLCAARNEAAALASALRAGAGDYLLKPLRVNEVQLRVQILLRRAYPDYRDQQQIRFGQYVFETPSNRITHRGVEIETTQKEFELALLLFGNLGRPLSRAYIQDTIWSHGGDDDELPSRTVDTHISRVRNKLQLKPEYGFRLTPVYGFGYQLEQIGGFKAN